MSRPTLPLPSLCRLCRRPITREAVKCPYCGARVSLSDLLRGGHPVRMPLRRRIILYAAGLAILAVGLVLWLGVLREIKAPVSSLDNSSAPSRPSNADCAALINELKRTPADQRGTSENRNRLRQCLEGRR